MTDPHPGDTSLFVRACRGEATDRIPVWMMRQAGRYLPEYRELRERVSFLELCRTPEIACEATLQPLRRFSFDAAILFSDLLVPLEAMGLDFGYPAGGPRVTDPVRTRADLDRLRPVDTRAALGYVPDAVRLLVGELGPTPLIGFGGAPFTLASYMVEGGPSKNFEHTKGMMVADPDAAHRLFGYLADTIIDYVGAQLDAGAAAYQLFDSWGGMLSDADYRAFCLEPLTRIVDGLRRYGAPSILYVNGGGHLLDTIGEVGADVVGVDWRLDLALVRAQLGDRARCLQGNLDPVVLLGPEETVRARTREVLERGVIGDGGYVFNLGHGVLPPTPPANVGAMVDTVHAFARGTGTA
jgi:uroporphyrinogen decarboxylase